MDSWRHSILDLRVESCRGGVEVKVVEVNVGMDVEGKEEVGMKVGMEILEMGYGS